MIKTLAGLALGGMILVGVPAVAHASEFWFFGDYDDHHHERAPEPLTIIGLAVGAGGIAAARWASGRKAAQKK